MMQHVLIIFPKGPVGQKDKKQQRCVILVDDEFFSSETFTIRSLPTACFLQRMFQKQVSVMLEDFLSIKFDKTLQLKGIL